MATPDFFSSSMHSIAKQGGLPGIDEEKVDSSSSDSNDSPNVIEEDVDHLALPKKDKYEM